MAAAITELRPVGLSKPDADDGVVLTAVLFCDLVSSTALAATMGDSAFGEVLSAWTREARRVTASLGGRVVGTRGDDVFALFSTPQRAVRCALGVRDAASAVGMDTRSAVHVCECVEIADDVVGIGVNIAARALACCAPGEIVVTTAVRDVVAGSSLQFAPKRARTLRGVPGRWPLHALLHTAATQSEDRHDLPGRRSAVAPPGAGRQRATVRERAE